MRIGKPDGRSHIPIFSVIKIDRTIIAVAGYILNIIIPAKNINPAPSKETPLKIIPYLVNT